MFDRKDKKIKGIEISLGILVGYVLVETVLVIINDKPWKALYQNELIVAGFFGVIASIAFLFWEKRKKAQVDSDLD